MYKRQVEVVTKNKSKSVAVGKWSPVNKFVQNPTYQKKDIKRFFRVGIYTQSSKTILINCLIKAIL